MEPIFQWAADFIFSLLSLQNQLTSHTSEHVIHSFILLLQAWMCLSSLWLVRECQVFVLSSRLVLTTAWSVLQARWYLRFIHQGIVSRINTYRLLDKHKMEEATLVQTELACFFMYPTTSKYQKSCCLERLPRQELGLLLMRNCDGKEGEMLHNPTGLICSF